MIDETTTTEEDKKPIWLVEVLSSDLTRNIAALLAVVMAGAALFVTSTTQRSLLKSQQEFQERLTNAQSQFERDRTSNAAWERYMEAAVKSPEMAAATSPFSGDVTKPQDVAYGWFVERILMAAEQTIYYNPDDPQWTDAFRYEVYRHKRYFLSDMFLKEQYNSMPSFCTFTKNVRAMVISSFNPANPEDSADIKRLREAEQSCQVIFKARNVQDA